MSSFTSYHFKRALLVVFLVIISAHLSSQVKYSRDPEYILSKKEANNLVGDFHATYPDTSIYHLHNYQRRNYMGNIGLAQPSYFVTYGTDRLGFRLYPNSLGADQIREEDVEYYFTKGPYASITGIAGTKQLQMLRMDFSHTYKRRLNIGLKLNRYNSKGYYLKQQSFANNLMLTLNYSGKKQKAGYYFYFLNNSNRNQENGGVLGDSISAQNVLLNKELLPVRLSSANRDNKEFKAMFNPWVKLIGGHDSLQLASLFFQVKSKFNFSYYKYKDAGIYNDAFYRLYYLDTLLTYDSTRLLQFHNSADLTFKSSGRGLTASVGYLNEINRLWQKADSNFTNDILYGDLLLQPRRNKPGSDSTNITAMNRTNVQYILRGANAGNYKLENNTSIVVGREGRHLIYLDLISESRNADHIYNYWVSNHFQWFNNGFSAQTSLNARLGYKFKKRMGVEGLVQNLRGYLFFDDLSQPRQYNGEIINLSGSVFAERVVLKHLGLAIRQTFQSTSHEAYVSLPASVTTAKVYYSAAWFKNNLLINFGTQVEYYSGFKGYAYMPALQMFYLQYDRNAGQYPFVDIYLNARIRPVNFFVRLENALQGLVGTNYDFVPGYFQTDRAVRFGLTWQFFD